MKNLILIIIIGVVVFFVSEQKKPTYSRVQTSSNSSNSNKILSDAYKNKSGDLQVKGSGKVIKKLADDTKGSKHQKFIIKLSTGQTLLVAHNIDLAPRINSLRVGDDIEFNGEYEWNSKGGVIHWTHHDPAGRHETGWIKHNGKIYK